MNEDDVDDSTSGLEPTLHDVLAVAIVLASKHPEEVPLLGDKFDELAASLYRPFVEFIIDHAYGGAEAPFMENTNYPILCRSMPELMKPIKVDVEQYTNDQYFSEGYLASLLLGDGTVYCPKCLRRPYQVIAIHGTDHPFKEWLKRHGWNVSSNLAVRRISQKMLRNIAFVYASHLFLSYKKLHMKLIFELSRATRAAAPVIPATELALTARTIQVVVGSWLNNLHGVLLPEQWFTDDFNAIAKVPCALDIFVAGILGSDGGIYCHFRIYQSNRRWIEALASKMVGAYGVNEPRFFGETCGVGGIRRRPKSAARFSASASEMIAPRVASFDMNRKDQHLIYLLRRMVRYSNFADKKRVEAFLEGTAKFIRKHRPS